MEWLYMLAIGFICIGSPIIMVLYIGYMPVYVIISFVVWLLSSIASIALSRDENKKWYERMLPSFFLTLVFTMIFVASIDTKHYMFDDENAMWFFAPSLCLPAIYFVGNGMRRALEKKRQEKMAVLAYSVDSIIHRYTPKEIGGTSTAERYLIEPTYVNQEVVSAVKIYRGKMLEVYKQYNYIGDKLKSILACSGCTSIKDKYNYLNSKGMELEQLNKEIGTYLKLLAGHRIELLSDDRDLHFKLKSAFGYLKQSKKCISEQGSIEDFIPLTQPKELSLFKCNYDPIILFIEQYYFCLFCNVILVFDTAGVFSTAIDPSAVRINIKRKTTTVTVHNGKALSNQYIAEDSKCISRGSTRSTWLHTCRDGSPDLRYSYNPKLEFRTDIYEYTIVEIAVAEKSISFSVSSASVGDAFEAVVLKYIQKHNNRHNSVPELLQLLKLLSDNEDNQIDSIIKVCADRTGSNGYFCKLVAD